LTNGLTRCQDLVTAKFGLVTVRDLDQDLVTVNSSSKDTLFWPCIFCGFITT